MNDKHAIRARILNKRKCLDEKHKKELDRRITGFLLASEIWRKANHIFLYASLPEEVNTWPVISSALTQGKYVGLPVIESLGEGRMNFYSYSDKSELESGLLNIQEPGKNCHLIENEPDLIVIPGLAFDHEGTRLGYGKGFYDRYLALHAGWNSFLLGLAYDFQIQPELPKEETDYQVMDVITENGFLSQYD